MEIDGKTRVYSNSSSRQSSRFVAAMAIQTYPAPRLDGGSGVLRQGEAVAVFNRRDVLIDEAPRHEGGVAHVTEGYDLELDADVTSRFDRLAAHLEERLGISGLTVVIQSTFDVPLDQVPDVI